jgi:ATP-dependent Clp protease adaptor protein ClpS
VLLKSGALVASSSRSEKIVEFLGWQSTQQSFLHEAKTFARYTKTMNIFLAKWIANTPALSGTQPDREPNIEFDRGLAVEEERPELKPPPLYKVFLVNDDYTPMGFVEYVLQKFFAMSDETATRVMLSVHTQGRGVCGIFTKDIADTKTAQVNDFSRHHQHPLMCTMEEA